MGHLRRFLADITLGMALATVVYSYLGEHAPRYVDALLVVFVIFVAGVVVAALVYRWGRCGKPG